VTSEAPAPTPAATTPAATVPKTQGRKPPKPRTGKPVDPYSEPSGGAPIGPAPPPQPNPTGL
jgi:hypothetical protein